MNNTKILHITPHLGGGVGTVVLNWLKKENEVNRDVQHNIASLEKNKNSMKEFKDSGMSIFDGIYANLALLKEWISQSDIVLIHWWNHPALFDIMVNLEFPPCRLIIWSHVSALNPPYIHSDKLIEFSDYFVFTSPVSYEAKEIQELPDYLREKLDVVWSACGTEIFDGFNRKEHGGFNIGLTGTVDYAKLHPDFVKMCSHINIPNVHFIVCSGDSQDRVKQDAINLGIANKFSFHERVFIKPYLAKYDIFGYPLQKKHYGTSEQVIGEAMMAGVVPVVLNNPAERYIIENGVTGIIADTPDEYCRAIEYLYYNPEIRSKIARNAITSAREKYSLTKKMKAWGKIFGKILLQDKRKRVWDTKKFKTGAVVFIESLGNYGKVFSEYIYAKEHERGADLKHAEGKIIDLFKSNSQWYSENKGGVKQYLKLFPHDVYLNEWKNLL